MHNGLEDQNRRLKKLLPESMLDVAARPHPPACRAGSGVCSRGGIPV
jgi:hypothetical protein